MGENFLGKCTHPGSHSPAPARLLLLRMPFASHAPASQFRLRMLLASHDPSGVFRGDAQGAGHPLARAECPQGVRRDEGKFFIYTIRGCFIDFGHLFDELLPHKPNGCSGGKGYFMLRDCPESI